MSLETKISKSGPGRDPGVNSSSPTVSRRFPGEGNHIPRSTVMVYEYSLWAVTAPSAPAPSSLQL